MLPGRQRPLVGGLSVLRYLAAAQTPVGVSRIARDLELNPSTCFNLLKTLVHEGLAVFDETTKTYSVGLGLLALAKGTLERWDDGLTFDIYQSEVEEARKRGYAVDHGHYAKGVTTVSTAVLDELKKPLMAISAVGIGAQMTKTDIKALGEDLRERGAEISSAMAGRKGAGSIRAIR